MSYEEFRERALAVYRESRGVPPIAAVILERKYGQEEGYKNIVWIRVEKAWKSSDLELEVFSLPKHAERRVRELADECNRDPMIIAPIIAKEVKKYIAGYALGDVAVKKIMKEKLHIKPLSKPLYRGGKSISNKVIYGRAGKKLRGEVRERFELAGSPEAIG